MEFDKSRVYTALDADELKQGDKVITARCMADLKTWVEADADPNIIELIQDETNTDRFTCKCHGSNKTYDSPLAYLVERSENCLKCKKCEVISDKSMHCDWVGTGPITSAQIEKCNHYEPKTGQKEDNMNWNYESLPERQEMGVSDHVIVAVEGCPYGQSGYYDYDMQAWFVDGCSEPVNVVAWQQMPNPPKKEE